MSNWLWSVASFHRDRFVRRCSHPCMCSIVNTKVEMFVVNLKVFYVNSTPARPKISKSCKYFEKL